MAANHLQLRKGHESMITLERADDGALVTPMVRQLDAKAKQLADAAGSIDPRQSWSEAMRVLRQDAAFQALIDSHLRLGLADGDSKREAGSYFLTLTPEEKAALSALWARDRAAEAQRAAPVQFSAGSFEAEIERTIKRQFGGDRSQYAEAMRATAAARPDLLAAYLRSAT
jgi:hypothetical protein